MSFVANGFEIVEDTLSLDMLNRITRELETIKPTSQSGSIRNIERKIPSIQKLVSSDYLEKTVSSYLLGKPKFVRAILFNKTHKNNWSVGWHQDKTIVVDKKFDRKNWGPWSIKDGITHVQPPKSILQQMVTLRIHLDDTDENNGCLRVLPNSHNLGVLTAEQIQNYRENNKPFSCTVTAGSAVVMRPLILHSSNKLTRGSKRRVLHLEYRSFKDDQVY